MAITYTWNFSQFDIAPTQDELTDVVVVVHWRLTAVDGDYVASNYGTAQLLSPNPSDFTPYDSITFDETVEWVRSSIDVASVEENLASQIERLRNPPVVSMKPPFDS
jgi:hypothetical protein